MAPARMFSFSSVGQPLYSASPMAGNGGHRSRGFFHPSPVICPGREPTSHELSNDLDFQEGITSVQALLRQHPKRTRGVLATVDHLKRLCIDHYFQDEIDNVVNSCVDLIHSGNLQDAALSMRLMREAGYSVSADEVLQKFANGNDDFNLAHSKHIRGLLSLQDMSHLNVGEASLFKAREFSSKQLRIAIKYLEPNLARYVKHSLDHPYHVSLMQYKARHHLSYLQSLPTRNIAMEKLALAEYQINKLQHQWEMQEVKRWWMDLGLAQEIPAARDQLLKWYMWAMTVLESFSFSRYRIELTKIISLIYIVDDIFDLVATQEELFLYNEAIQMWDLGAADSLPSYMISCYKTIYTVTNDIADMVRKEHGLNPINHLKKAGRWLSSNQVPTSEDYLRNGVITSGAPLVFLHIFFMLGHDLRETDVNHITSVVACPAKIMRLRDDMGSAKDEAQERLDGSYKELYLRENPHGNAEEHMLKMIEDQWVELNTVCFPGTKSSLSPSFVGASLNFARMVGVMYDYDDKQRLPVLEDYTRMLLL